MTRRPLCPLWGTGVSPGMIVQEGPFTSRQVNVNGSGQNITGDAANEPSIAVDPTDHNRMVIGWRQFNSVTSNFRQAGWGWTNNGGTTWTFPGVLESNVFRSDPVLTSDDTGRFFWLSLLETYDVTLWRSLNGGQNFTNIGPAKGGDKQWFVIDNNPASIGYGFQYQFWDYASPFAPFEFSRSTDGGFTWMNPIDIPNAPQWGTCDVDSNGNLFFGGVTQSLTQFWCIRSTNAKNAAVTPTFDQVTEVNMGGVISYFDTVNPEGLIGQVFLAVDRSGTSSNNNVYMLASVQPTGFSTGSDVMFVRSTDGGQTFSAPEAGQRRSDQSQQMALVRHAGGRAEWTDRFRLARHAQRREQHRFAALLFLQPGRRHDVVAQRRGQPCVQSVPRLSEPEQAGRLHDDRFGQYRRRCRVCRHLQFRAGRLLCPRRAGDSADADAEPNATATADCPRPLPSPLRRHRRHVYSHPIGAPHVCRYFGLHRRLARSGPGWPKSDLYHHRIQLRSPASARRTNVTMTDTLPASVNFVSVTPSQGTCTGTSTSHL